MDKAVFYSLCKALGDVIVDHDNKNPAVGPGVVLNALMCVFSLVLADTDPSDQTDNDCREMFEHAIQMAANARANGATSH